MTTDISRIEDDIRSAESALGFVQGLRNEYEHQLLQLAREERPDFAADVVRTLFDNIRANTLQMNAYKLAIADMRECLLRAEGASWTLEF